MNFKPSFRPRLGLPLLAKELIELASRRRTFLLRMLYGLLLFGFSMLFLSEEIFRSRGNTMAAMGRGRDMLIFTVIIQAMGIYLFLPMLATGAIANEKESNTISLLFLTKLSPWTIIFEKLGSRLITMTSCILLSVPLFAFAYSLGGVNVQSIVMGIVVLFLTLIHVGTLAIFCSSFFSTMAGAFIACYIIGLINILIPPIFCETLYELFGARFQDEEYLLLFPLGSFLEGYGNSLVGTASFLTKPFIFHVVAMLANSLFYLVLARFFLLRRAFTKPKRRLMKLFLKIDGMFNRANDQLAGGVVLIKASNKLPLDNPVYWRETTKRSLGSFRHLVRLLVGLELPVVVFGMIPIFLAFSPRDSYTMHALMAMGLWILITLIIIVKSASMMSIERAHDSLDTLLTTPLETKEIIRQKIRGLRPLLITLCIPYCTIAFLRIFSEHGITFRGGYGERINSFEYGFASLITFAIYLPMLVYLSFYLGMRIRSRTRAIVSALMAIVAWCVVPVITIILISEIGRFRWGADSSWPILLLSGPASFVCMMEIRELGDLHVPIIVSTLLNSAIYFSFLLWFRRLAFKTADKHLGRSVEEDSGFPSFNVEADSLWKTSASGGQ